MVCCRTGASSSRPTVDSVCQTPSIVGEVAHAEADGEINPAHVNTNASHRSPCLVATPALLFAA